MDNCIKYVEKIVSDRKVDTIPTENTQKPNSLLSLREDALLKCLDDCHVFETPCMIESLTKGLSRVHMDCLLKNWISALKQDMYRVAKKLPKLSPWDDAKVRMFLRGSTDSHSVLFKISTNPDLLEKIAEYSLCSNEERYIQYSLDLLSIFPKNECSSENIKDFGEMLTRMGEFLSVVSSFDSINLAKKDVRFM